MILGNITEIGDLVVAEGRRRVLKVVKLNKIYYIL